MTSDIYSNDEKRLLGAWVRRAPRLVPAPAYTRQVLPCSSHGARCAFPAPRRTSPHFRVRAFARIVLTPTRDGPPEPHQTERARLRRLQVRDSSAWEARP
jgi:hypothetical protein